MSYQNPNLKTQKTFNSNVYDNNSDSDDNYDSHDSHDSDIDYIINQSNILKKSKYKVENNDSLNSNDNIIQQVAWNVNSEQKLKKNNKYEYDPYIDYLKKSGLNGENYKSKIITNKINIDSRARIQKSTIIKDNDILLNNNPLFFETSDNLTFSNQKNYLLTITIPKNILSTLSVGDRITINNVKSETQSLMATYSYQENNQTFYGYSVIFQNDINYLIIKTDFETSITNNQSSSSYITNITPDLEKSQFSSFSPNFYVGDGISYFDLLNYDTYDMYVTLSGFIGTNIGNIPTNFLNTIHRIYFLPPDKSDTKYINIPNSNNIVEKITGFYIKLPFYYSNQNQHNNPLPYEIYSNMVINIDFKFIGGIPINKMNCDIPTTNDNINGYYNIYSKTNKTISIKLDKQPFYLNKTPITSPEIGELPISFGENSIIISKIIQLYNGNTDPNNYSIELPLTIHNIFMIKLISTQFPNTSMTFKKNKNNKIYWKNLDDGDIVYSAEISEGNYNSTDLALNLQNAMYSVSRHNKPPIEVNYFYNSNADPDIENYLNEINATKVNKGGYTNKILFEITLDENTNIATFKSYKEAKLRRPIIKITDINGNPPPEQDVAATAYYEPPYTLKILHPNHGLSIGDQIKLSNFASDSGISDTILNKIHYINNIDNKDTYQIIIDNFDLTLDRTKTYGGYSAVVYVPNKFSLLFNYSDTVGNELGFRKVATDIAITDYNTIIQNTNKYANEIQKYDASTKRNYVYDDSGQLVVLKNNSLKLTGNDYILMKIGEFSGNRNFGGNVITDYFAKINLSENPGNVLYDTFVSTPHVLYDMIDLKTLNISLFSQDGKLYDFNGIDHSFVIELLSLDLLPQKTGINANNNFM